MLELLIGLDAEFMAYHQHQAVYPLLDEKFGLQGIGCDEFGHCIEIRPKEANTAEGLVTNTMKAIAELPGEYLTYKHENVHTMNKATFIKLLRAQGTGKIIPGCKNIYGEDILNDCEMDITARKAGKRIVFCGMHVHVSATDIRRQSITIKDNRENVKIHTPIELPVGTLTYLFDKFLFKPLSNDNNFNVGRYRSPGFYEVKTSNHFEYRSLGSSALQPKRIALIFEIIKEIVNNIDYYTLRYMHVDDKSSKIYTKRMDELIEALKKTKEEDIELKKLWVPWQ